eukprot:132334-Chlamydomonas_euryale.AAC.2
MQMSTSSSSPPYYTSIRTLFLGMVKPDMQMSTSSSSPPHVLAETASGLAWPMARKSAPNDAWMPNRIAKAEKKRPASYEKPIMKYVMTSHTNVSTHWNGICGVEGGRAASCMSPTTSCAMMSHMSHMDKRVNTLGRDLLRHHQASSMRALLPSHTHPPLTPTCMMVCCTAYAHAKQHSAHGSNGHREPSPLAPPHNKHTFTLLQADDTHTCVMVSDTACLRGLRGGSIAPLFFPLFPFPSPHTYAGSGGEHRPPFFRPLPLPLPPHPYLRDGQRHGVRPSWVEAVVAVLEPHPLRPDRRDEADHLAHA